MLEVLLEQLGKGTVFVPASQVTDHGTEATISLASFVAGGRKYVPVFTSESHLLEWAAGRDYEILSLSAVDLALSLGPGTWIAINSGRESEVMFSPDEVELLAGVLDLQSELALSEADSTDDLSSASPVVDEEMEESEPAQEADACSDGYRSGEPVSQPLTEQLIAVRSGDRGLEKRIVVLAELCQVFPSFSEVLEAYSLDAHGDYPSYVLGLVMPEISTERRFALVDRIGDVSRRHFGLACAIEIYDQENAKNLGTWQLFSMHRPFYLKEPEGTAEKSTSAEPVEKCEFAVKGDEATEAGQDVFLQSQEGISLAEKAEQESILDHPLAGQIESDLIETEEKPELYLLGEDDEPPEDLSFNIALKRKGWLNRLTKW